jgi:excisionase family DNA binding protein
MANTWLTAPQAAELTGLAPFSLQRMAKRGELRYQRLGRLWLFDRREIRRLKRRLAAKRRERQDRGEGDSNA